MPDSGHCNMTFPLEKLHEGVYQSHTLISSLICQNSNLQSRCALSTFGMNVQDVSHAAVDFSFGHEWLGKKCSPLIALLLGRDSASK
jgi:hypothetical protein